MARNLADMGGKSNSYRSAQAVAGGSTSTKSSGNTRPKGSENFGSLSKNACAIPNSIGANSDVNDIVQNII